MSQFAPRYAAPRGERCGRFIGHTLKPNLARGSQDALWEFAKLCQHPHHLAGYPPAIGFAGRAV